MSEYRYDFHSKHPGKIQADREVAIRTCTPYANGADLITCDSAQAVYRLTLEAMGVQVGRVDPSALPAILDGHKQSIGRGGRVQMAMDGSATESFLARNPDAARIRVAG